MGSVLPRPVIVTDDGFRPETWRGGFVLPEGYAANGTAALDLAPDTDPARLRCWLDAPMIRIDVPHAADGRALTLARRLRMLGYRGRLRAAGAL